MKHSKEFVVTRLNGWLIAILEAVVLPGIGAWLIYHVAQRGGEPPLWFFLTLIPLVIFWIFMMCGFFKLEPNVAAVLLLFGRYKGTVRECGFYWANPLLSKKKVSLRAHNFNGEKLKVNDQMGNPIEIAAVVVWRVLDTAEAVFDVEDYREYVEVQSESALRQLASHYPYDTIDGGKVSLRGSIDEVSNDLQTQLGERLNKAGVEVIEARLSHLAYAPEIAEAMLKRQQATAIVAARRTLVDGAVGMVEIALQRLKDHGTLELDEERKAVMVSNLLVVLCGDHAAQPVVNAGSLY